MKANIDKIKRVFIGEKRNDSVLIRLLIFGSIWLPCFAVFLNLFPGTYSTDTSAQMAEALGYNHFTNYNPFVNTIVVTLFVKIGLLAGNINVGIALYTLFQFSLYAAVGSFITYLFYQKGFKLIVVAVVLAFYAINPVNLLYSVGMWKDTFFAVTFLACSVMIYLCLTGEREWNAKNKVLLFLLVLFTSLTRNSSWTALLIFGVVLFAKGFIRNRKDSKSRAVSSLLKNMGTSGRVGLTVVIGAVMSVIVMSVIYPSFGVGNVSASRALSLQVQQIARSVQDNEITETEKERIQDFLQTGKGLNDIVENYDPTIIDPLKSIFDFDVISNRGGNFSKLYFDMMRAHPKAYLDAFVDHTILYWWPVKPKWIWDNRIYDNDYGIARSSKLFLGHDIGGELYDKMKVIPGFRLITSSASALWLIILCMIINSLEKKSGRNILYLPPLIIIVGLILFSYASLFRYTYAAFILKPMYFLYLYAEVEEKV
ncbi:hypothetical protein bpr_I0464 [Butyrivibrio proteoclasticus B316]|uniref:Dolichyl-phosphate-mannose-protein mannosyltransferase n=1 Tax=Butyrivibrio proteoclasticus (strain ATCC 51982 / DSM 14932 / B316) TaxID=515622 RepID=E0S011_BUTPB|nr:DUF6020 family protein [Butyrivibrio proteoclasticus]ADL33212.1 hypothetical protein bpr_I0464 [Butyrivibrio proteoclasticus B316]